MDRYEARMNLQVQFPLILKAPPYLMVELKWRIRRAEKIKQFTNCFMMKA
jgi:hypothetical protein